MKKTGSIAITIAAVVCGLVGSAVRSAAAETADTKMPSAAIPRMPDGTPNLNGFWEHPFVPDVTKDGKDQKGVAELPYTEWGANDFKNYDPAQYDYTGHCLPFGLMRSMNGGGYPIQIVQYGKYLAMLFEQSNWFHVIALGRDHPKQLEPTWFGDSIGKWDGDTLVIDTIGSNGKTRIDTIGHPLTDQLHIVERINFADINHLNYEVTVIDPKAYTKPWKNTRIFTRMKPGDELIEYSCEENNTDFTHGHIK